MPISGGLWDQDPKFIETIWIVSEARAKHEAEEERREKAGKLGHRVANPM